MDKIAQAIFRLLEKHRIVFWYDAKKELRHEFESLLIPGVETVELNNNEYRIKYRVLREKPTQKFLLYHEGPRPEDLDNWLLDVLLAQGEFSADQVSLWMNELELPPSLRELVQEHIEFFKDEQRRLALKARLTSDDSHNTLRTKMLAVCVSADIDSRIESVLEVLLAELAEGRADKFEFIQQCNLDPFLWSRLDAHFGYKSKTPGTRDFSITLFKACYASSLDEQSPLTQDALVFLKRWRDSVRYQGAFEQLSEECANILSIERDLQNRDIRTLIDVDFFKLIDRKILSSLVQQILDRTLSAGDCAKFIWRRRSTHWYKEFRDIYEALNYGSQFIHELDHADLQMESLSDGIRKYTNTWYRMDQYYRRYIYYVRASGQNTLLAKLSERIENLYSNNFLRTVNDNWQQLIDPVQIWGVAPTPSQSGFFARYINEYLGTKNKVAVIISDALRYEVGQELVGTIEQAEGYSAELEPLLATLPSYTQLGMAALLPHQELSILPDGNVQVDRQASLGLDNRSRILSNAVGKGAIALRAEDLLSMNRDQYREVTKGAQVVYVYHNQIDQVGDDKMSEGRVFDAVEKTLGEIRSLLKKLYDAYFSNILITSDHGFIYQNQPLDESDFSYIDAEGEEIFLRNRRFVIGKGMRANESMKTFNAGALGLAGDFQVMIPKSINRLRVQGAGSRYVHGGATLQEVVLPLIKVNKTRNLDTSLVDVDIITSSSSIITAGQLSIAFYQTEPVSSKRQARQVRAGIYSQDGVLLSDSHTLTFDLTSENAREREVRQQFVLSSKADQANNQTVYLKLEEPVKGTSHFQEYKTFAYQLRRSFTTDFDF